MKNWISNEIDYEAAVRLAESGRLPLPFAQLMVARGLNNNEQIQAFCNPKLADLKDPFELSGIRDAAHIVLQTIVEKKRICIFGDYDVDGISSTGLLTRFFHRLDVSAHPFIPSRMDEGYGLSVDAVKRCVTDCNPNLLITVDCGVNSVEAVEYIKRCGIGVIVTDHHAPAEVYAQPDAMVNPKLDDDETVKMLAGVGVAFKLCHGIVKLARQENVDTVADIDLREWLDLVALGTVCDIVPLIHENRVLVRQGLGVMRKTRHVGVNALLKVARIKQPSLDAHHLGFQLGPRLNAAGRLADACASLELLTTDDESRAAELALELDAHNRDRRQIEAETFDEACQIIERTTEYENQYATVVWKVGWHSGVIGIVASRLVRKYRRPVVVIAVDEDGIGRGSGRSVESCNLVEELRTCEQMLVSCGGHAMAAGLEIQANHLAAFSEAFEKAVRQQLEHADLRERVDIAAWIHLDEITQELYASINNLKPFGSGNKRPVWAAKQVEIKSKHAVGEKHCRLTFVQGARRMEGIYFNHSVQSVPEGIVDIAFCVQMNDFKGRSKLELQVQDIRKTE